jgi:dihydrofolate reductase
MSCDRKLVLYIAASLDGFIAGPGGDLSFLSDWQQAGEDYGYGEFLESVDTVILGRKTYEKVLSFGIERPYGDREVVVLTRTAMPSRGKVTFFSGNIGSLVNGLKEQEGSNIFCDGGAETVHELLTLGLIDEIILSVVPVLLGDGIPLFRPGRPKMTLTLPDTRRYDGGLVQLHYKIMPANG